MKRNALYLIQYHTQVLAWQTYEVSNSIREARKRLKAFSLHHNEQPWRIIRREITETIIEEVKP